MLIKFFKKHNVLFKYLTAILIFAFITLKIDDSFKFNKFDFNQIKLNYFFISIFLLIFALFSQYVIWYLITVYSSVVLPFLLSLKIRAYSELGKYVPGRALLYGILFVSYKKYNVSSKKIAFCSIIESVSSLISAVIVTLILLLFGDIELEQSIKLFSIAFLIFSLIILHPVILQFILNIFFKLFRKEKIEIKISYLKILSIVFLNTLLWLIFGLAFYFLINSFISISFSNYWYLTGAFAISSFFGFIAFFVPAGLGIREGSLILLLGKIVVEPFSSLASFSSRLLIIFGDLIITLIFYLTDKIFYKGYTSKFNI